MSIDEILIIAVKALACIALLVPGVFCIWSLNQNFTKSIAWVQSSLASRPLARWYVSVASALLAIAVWLPWSRWLESRQPPTDAAALEAGQDIQEQEQEIDETAESAENSSLRESVERLTRERDVALERATDFEERWQRVLAEQAVEAAASRFAGVVADKRTDQIDRVQAELEAAKAAGLAGEGGPRRRESAENDFTHFASLQPVKGESESRSERSLSATSVPPRESSHEMRAGGK